MRNNICRNKTLISGNDKLSILILSFLSLFLIATNLSSAISVYIYAFLCFAYIVLFDFKYGISIVFLNVIYLAYSFIVFPDAVFFGPSELISACVLLTVARYIVFRFIISFKSGRAFKFDLFTFIVLLIALYFSICQFEVSITSVVSTLSAILCALFFSNEIDEEESVGKIALALSIILFWVVIYYFFRTRFYDNEHFTWVGNRFTGVRDPNNYALMANFTIVLLCMAKNGVNRIFRIIAIVLLSVGVVATISMSGILTLIAIIGVMMFAKHKIRFSIVLLIILIVAVLFITNINNYTFSDSTTLGAVMVRVQNLVNNLQQGDYYSATTTRWGLWESYMKIFRKLSDTEKIFGNRFIVNERLAQGYMASHNTFIDILITYGAVGLTLFSLLPVMNMIRSVKKQNLWKFVLCAIFVANLFFRTIMSVFLWIGVLS